MGSEMCIRDSVKAGMPASEAAVLPVRQGAVYVVTPGGFKVAD